MLWTTNSIKPCWLGLIGLIAQKIWRALVGEAYPTFWLSGTTNLWRPIGSHSIGHRLFYWLQENAFFKPDYSRGRDPASSREGLCCHTCAYRHQLASELPLSISGQHSWAPARRVTERQGTQATAAWRMLLQLLQPTHIFSAAALLPSNFSHSAPSPS